MPSEETIARRLNQEPSLFFVEKFLEAFPKAKLYLVGGGVRDAIVGRVMNEKDFDFVVCGLEPEILHDWFEKRGKIDLVGRDFGVFKFMPEGFSTKDIEFVDIALPRTETSLPESVGGYKDFEIQSDPNLPIEDDLARRDFTINAMAYDVRSKQLIDPFNGQRDLAEKKIRAVGNPTQRFSEDLSRVLRAVRFAAELQFDIEPKTLAAVQDMGQRTNDQRERDGELEYIIPKTTMGQELGKALERNPSGAVVWFTKSRLMHVLFPEIQQIIDVDNAYTIPLHQIDPGCLMITLSVLLRAATVEQADRILKETGLNTLPRDSSRRVETDMILWIISRLHPPITVDDVQKMPAAEFEKWFFNNKGRHLIKVMGFLGNAEVRLAVKERKQAIESRWLIEPGEKIPPLLSGDDVLRAGVEQGPKVRKILEDCRSKQLEGELMTREDARKWLNTRI